MSKSEQMNEKLAFAAREGPPQGIVAAPTSMSGSTKPVVMDATSSKASNKVRNTLSLSFQ
jgi:hypothetical protein